MSSITSARSAEPTMSTMLVTEAEKILWHGPIIANRAEKIMHTVVLRSVTINTSFVTASPITLHIHNCVRMGQPYSSFCIRRTERRNIVKLDHKILMTPAEQKALTDRMKASAPSDYIYLERGTQEKLFEIYIDGKLDYIPADLVFEGIVPIKDVVMKLGWMKTANDDDNTVGSEARILMFDDPVSMIAVQQDGSDLPAKIVGVIILKTERAFSEPMTMLFPVCSMRGDNGLFTLRQHLMGILELNSETKRMGMESVLRPVVDDLKSMVQDIMTAWYTCEVSLLHPLTHTVFEHYQVRKLRGKEKTVLPKDEQGRVVKYMKYHHITPEDFEFDLDKLGVSEEIRKKYTRRTLVWRVVGHWRTTVLEDGTEKTRFIQGYWKGPLRDFQMNLDKQKRIIAV